MTLDEKIGLMLHGTASATGGPLGSIGVGPGYDLGAAEELINTRFVTCMISRLSLPPAELAAQNNALQAVAARGRLGIPITISTDPRNHFGVVMGASVGASGFSQWPETLGLGAIGDVDLVRRFGDVVRQEYRGVGFHMALSPQADLSTSPRWPRIEGTFGEDPTLVRALVGAYVEGVQGGPSGAGTSGVAAVVKHWVGYGASRDGFDGHSYYGRYSAFPGGRFQDHVDAFLDAFDVSVAGVMPTYNILEGLTIDGGPVEQVGAGFSSQIMLDLLRGTYGYDGLILSDWAIMKDFSESCRTGQPQQTPEFIAMPWGVEDLTKVQKVAKGVNAGLDQLGGENDPAPLLEAVRSGFVTEARIDESARRVLIQKFELGLFESPFVDPELATQVIGRADFVADAEAAQRRSLVHLKGRSAPLAGVGPVFVHGFDAGALRSAGVVVTDELGEATVAVVGMNAPHQRLHPNHFFGNRQHEGDLDFKEDDGALLALREISAAVPTTVVVHLDRPAILANVLGHATSIYGEFGASPAAVVDVLCGRAEASGRLPFALPASMEAVLTRDCDVPNGDPAPLFPLFFSA